MANSSKNLIKNSKLIGSIRTKKRVGSFSNLAAPTYKNPSYNSEKGVFNLLKNSVAPESGSSVISRKVLKNTRGYPYRKARLIDHGGDVTKPWHIIFYAWDIGSNKLVRKRVCKAELNTIRHINQRYEKATDLINELNDELASGGYLETHPKTKKEVSAFDFHGYKLLAAFTYVEKYKREVEKKSKSTSKEYNYTKHTFEQFFKAEGIDKNISLRQVSPTFLHRYCIYLRNKLNLSNKTYNDRIGNMHSCFEVLRKLDLKLWPEANPAARLEKLKVTSKTHAAYTVDQLKKFTEAIEPTDPQLLLFIRFIYYTLARPKEIRFIKVGHIRMEFNKILIVGETAKTDIEKYVGISSEFAAIIQRSGILNAPPEHYVFTNTGTPGATPVGSSYFYKRFKEHLKSLGFKKLNAAYSMYSFKHTGAVQLYLATKDPYIVQHQCRHTTLDQTMTYLKDLGLFVDFSALQGWKGF